MMIKKFKVYNNDEVIPKKDKIKLMGQIVTIDKYYNKRKNFDKGKNRMDNK